MSLLKKAFLLLVILCSSSLHPLFASESIHRKVLAIYDPRIYPDIFLTTIHQAAEVVLNYLGLEVIYQSLEAPLPSHEEMNDFVGILSWINRPSAIPDPSSYCTWIRHQMGQGKKYIIMGEPGYLGAVETPGDSPCKQLLKDFGLEYRGLSSDDPYFMEIVEKDSSMVEFERKLNLAENLEFTLFRAIDPESKVYLKMRLLDVKDSVSDLILTNRHGGFAYTSYIFYENETLDRRHWRIDPFRFFNEAFSLSGLPRPDVTTLEGRRIFFSHVDGDGMFNVSRIDRKSFAAEVIHENIVKRYEGLPITLSLITGYLDMPDYQGDQALAMYRNVFSPPQVDVASHGYTHPLEWKTGKVALKIPGYRFDAGKEIRDSIQQIRKLLESLGIKKPVSTFLWTGDCLPTEQQIAIANEGDILNMNGGDAQFDRKYDSYMFVTPLGIRRGDSRQIYTGEANENVYTNLWEGPYYGFSDVILTFQNTEHPRRIKPINIYYHYYSGEFHSSLKALVDAYDYALSQEVIPIHAKNYIRIVRDFFGLTLSKIGEGFHVHNKGDLRTIRFDAENRNVDLARSKGIIGFFHFQNNLYVTLDESEDHVLYLTPVPPRQPYLINASFLVRGFTVRGNEIRFSKQGWYRSEILLGGLPPQARYSVRAGGQIIRVKSDSEGRMKIEFPSSENGGPAQEVLIHRETV